MKFVSKPSSPLRYPGGKSSLHGTIVELLRLNKLELCEYAEPYAGGCGLALSLLFNNHVSHIHVNDIDPAIWAFWNSVLNETQALVEKIEQTPVTIAEWINQRAVYKEASTTNALELGFSAFFLNRTNRSGIIKGAGAIGGLEQCGNYKIDCRYNKTELIRRIVRISKYRESITLKNVDALDFINQCGNLPKKSFLFIDPPYYKQGSNLYTNFYRHEDHKKLAETVLNIDRNWIVTYDDTCDIREMYQQRRIYNFDIKYSLNQKKIGKELLVASKRLRVPLFNMAG